MKYFTGIFLVISSIFTFSSCENLKTFLNPEQEHIVGGYSKPRNITNEEVALFKQVTASLQGVEYKPKSVSTQIVAGTNYRFLCNARTIDNNGKKGKRHYAAIVIHKPLNPEEKPRILSIDRQQ